VIGTPQARHARRAVELAGGVALGICVAATPRAAAQVELAIGNVRVMARGALRAIEVRSTALDLLHRLVACLHRRRPGAADQSLAKTAREILPEAVPGKALSQLSCAEFVQLIVRRHVEWAHESRMQDGFQADGRSLQEWTFGMARVAYRTMNPAEDARLQGEADPMTHEMRFFADVMAQLGRAFKHHVASSFDACVHLRHELDLAADGHRPMSESFRATCDEMLVNALEELAIPHHVVGDTLPSAST
jgi:hypothetical protein